MALRSIVCFLCLLGFVAPAAVSAQGRAAIEVGDFFPDLTLRTLRGDEASISDYRGQKVVLHVFASW